MNLIFNLTIRTPVNNIYDGPLLKETCANCNGCVGIIIKSVTWHNTRIKLKIWEADYECDTFDTTIDIYHATDSDIQCSKFKALEYKKL